MIWMTDEKAARQSPVGGHTVSGGEQMARFIVYLEPAEEGGYIASVPALPGCVTQGETREEALAMAQDAIVGYVASLKKHGEPLPYGIDKAEVQTVTIEVA